jgi:hypothetical protein
VLTAFIAYVPAIIFVGVVALVPARNLVDFVLPSYGEYYGYVISAIMVFVAFAAPEMLCTDRRSGMLGIYLASPLNRDTYLLAKGWRSAPPCRSCASGPPLLMLVANVLQSQGPTGVGDILDTLRAGPGGRRHDHAAVHQRHHGGGQPHRPQEHRHRRHHPASCSCR